ncbi:MAG: histidine phosphatase family protein [Candidatus Electrothrix sp. YB6]
MPTRLLLLRHGPTAAPAGCFVGSTDVPLSGSGLARLDSLIPQLRQADYWYCSPMRRTRQTLERLQQSGCPVGSPVYDERLREINFGRWEMKTFAEISTTDQDQLAAWQQYLDFVFPEGEAVPAFLSRVNDLLAEFSAAGSTVAIVTHGGVIRTMICLALSISPRNYLLFDVQPASLTILDLFSEGGVLRGLNL